MNFKPSSPRLDTAADVPSQTPNEPATASDQTNEAIESETSDESSPALPASELRLENAMRADRFRLARQRKQIPGEPFEQRLEKSIRLRRRRESFSPRLEYPSDLPISSYRDEIVELIRTRQTIVVCGETGSGKSTQLPKFCLEAGLGRQAMIGHTQPRRLAARSIATRLCEELECQLGGQVGYQVRFGDQTGPDTLVKLMTDGILLAETGSDRFLDQYDALIIDEAHERSLNIDFLLAYLKGLQSKRPDLKIIITSATIDAERFAQHFGDDDGPAPIFNVEGRGYPVEMRYLPWEDVTGDESRGYDLANHVIAGIKNLSRSGTGDTLVFLPTERDIRIVSHRVAGHYKRMGLEGRVEVLPLYARLPQKDQQRIFHPTGQKQRLIFATNVAESSLTVPGIRYVIDAGTARISRYSPRSKLQRLPIEPVSRASADQRAGRCGRVGPGICVRLYSAEDYQSREAFTTPEIRRTNLASVVLQSMMLGFGSLESLPLLDVPRPESIREGVQTLVELGAIDSDHGLTQMGRQLGRMPVDPRIGRIILAADELNVLPEILPIAAAMEIPDPRQRPQDNQQAADQAHAEFRDGQSDFLSFLRLWKYYEQARAEHSRNRLTRELKKRFLSPTRMREWSDTYRQLREIAGGLRKSSGKQSNKPAARIDKIRLAEDGDHTVDKERYQSIHQALLTGFLTGVATSGEGNTYIGPRNLKLFLWPGSGVFESKPKWIVAAELVETTKQYARTVAKIQPQWIESVAAHLLKSSYSDPHWSRKSNGAFCYQRQSLFGLPIVVRRRVPLSPIDPATARDLLIQHGLVEQQLVTNARFVRHNRALRESFAVLAAKTRRRDLVVDDYVVAQFYQSVLPAEVCDKGRLEKLARGAEVPDWARRPFDSISLASWLQSPPPDDDETSSVFMKPSDLMEASIDEISEAAFPDKLSVGRSELPLEYRYEPGADDDGISLRIHQAAVSQISDDRLEWLVPGLLHGKIVAMIKSLPKRIRRNLVPAADVAKQIYDELIPQHGEVPFLPALCQSMSRHAEMPVTPNDFQEQKLDQHLRFLVQVVDDDGNTLAASRRADSLVRKFGSGDSHEQVSAATDDNVSDLPPQPMTAFDIDDFPSEVIRKRGGVRVAQYPALIDEGEHVRVRLFADAETAETAMRQGLTRLYAIAERKELKRQVRWLPDLDQTKIRLSGVVPAARFEPSMIDLLARVAFVEKQPIVRTRDEFQSRRENRIERISVAVQEVAKWLSALGTAYLAMRGEWETFPESQFAEVHRDVKSQLNGLLHEQFLSATPWSWLSHYPRYLEAIRYRLDKVRCGGGERDAAGRESVARLMQAWQQTLPESARNPAGLASEEFRWMLEELRVSLFAQPLGTSMKVSVTRCEKWLQKRSAGPSGLT